MPCLLALSQRKGKCTALLAPSMMLMSSTVTERSSAGPKKAASALQYQKSRDARKAAQFPVVLDDPLSQVRRPSCISSILHRNNV